jgi:hypothetical protein
MKTDLEIAQDVIADLECKLAVANREKSSVDRKVRSAATAAIGNNKARFALSGLNKESEGAGRMVLTIERELAEARKRLAQVEHSIACVKANRGAVESAGHDHNRLFEIMAPDGRKLRQKHASLDAARKVLMPGYRVSGEVFGGDADGNGGFVSVPGAPSPLKALLDAHGDDLRAWLAAEHSFARLSNGADEGLTQ